MLHTGAHARLATGSSACQLGINRDPQLTALVQAHAGARGVPGSATALVALLHAPNVLEVRLPTNLLGISQAWA